MAKMTATMPATSPAEQSRVAAVEAKAALSEYWNALEGTLDPHKVAAATENALVGNAEEIAQQVRERFHPDDRLMLWFDFFNQLEAGSGSVIRSVSRS